MTAPDESDRRSPQPVWRTEPSVGCQTVERPYCPVCVADPDAVDPNGNPPGTMEVTETGALICQRYGASHYRHHIDAVRRTARPQRLVMNAEPLTRYCQEGHHHRCHGYLAPAFTTSCHCSCHEIPGEQPRNWSAATGRYAPTGNPHEDSSPASGQVFYLVDGEPHLGGIADYARAHEMAHYVGLDVPDVVWTWNVVLTPDAPGGATWGWTYHHVEVTAEPYDNHDRATVVLRVLDQQASYRIDGRA